jgi:hypothetical protein
LRQLVEPWSSRIRRRLTPGQLDEVLHHGRGAGTDFVANLGRTVSANPIPAVLVGVGLLWLLLAPKAPATPQAATPAETTAPASRS